MCHRIVPQLCYPGLNAGSPSKAPSVMVSAPPLQTTHLYSVVNQLPLLGKFKREDLEQEGGNFEEWIEKFEMVAKAYGWDAKARLANLTTRLQRQAYSFYRSHSPEQRADYGCLKTELLTHFTPVRLQAAHIINASKRLWIIMLRI